MKVSHLNSSCQRLTAHVDRGSGFASVQVLADSGYCLADDLKSCPGVDHGARHPTLDRCRAALMTLPACNVGGTRPTHRHRRTARRGQTRRRRQSTQVHR